MKSPVAITLCVHSALLCCGCFSSQYVGSGANMVPLTTLPRLLDESSVTITLTTRELIYGKVLNGGTDPLHILPDGKSALRQIPGDSILSISTTPRAMPIVGGALVGGAIVGGIAYMVAQPQRRSGGFIIDLSGPIAVAGGVIGTVVGGTFGAVSSPAKMFIFPTAAVDASARQGVHDVDLVDLELDRLIEEGHTYFIGKYKGHTYRFEKTSADLSVEKYPIGEVNIVRASRRYLIQLGVLVH